MGATAAVRSIIVFVVLLSARVAAPSCLEAADEPKLSKTIDQWITQLKDGDVAARREAAGALAASRGRWEKAGPIFLKVENEESFSTVLNALHDSDAKVRASIAAALGWIRGPQPGNSATEARNAFTELQKCLEDSDAAVRCYAACSLIDFASLSYSKDPTSQEVVAVLFDCLGGGRRELWSEAASALAKANLGERDVVYLEKLLDHEEPSIRYLAAVSLAKPNVRSGAKRAIPSMLAKINHPEPKFRAIVIDALGELNLEAPVVVPALIGSLTDSDPLVKTSSARAIGRFGQQAKDATAGLLTALRDSDPTVRAAACESLGRIQGDPQTAVPALLAMLDDQADTVQSNAIQALGAYGAAAKEVVPALHRRSEGIVAGNNSTGNLFVILSALLSIDPSSEKTSQLLIGALRNPERETLRRFLELSRKHGPAAKAAAPRLAEFVRGFDLTGPNYEFVLVTGSLEAIGPEAKVALPSLIDAYGRTKTFQSRIRRTVEKIDPEAAKALPVP